MLSYDYNDEGIRTNKTVNGVEHTYYLSGSQIVAEEWGSNLCVYLYDADGSPIGMRYRTTSMAKGDFYTFWFEKNLQGDIVAVYNESGTKVYTYQYDAWGNCTATPVSSIGSNIYAQYNPFRYRGYYYDSELGMYYLQSRYYDPAIGRFINSDGQLNGGLLGYNQFAYCANNPVMNVDPNGHAWWHWALAATVVVACAVATVATCGGFAAAATAVGLVASGVAAATPAATIAASAFIASSTAFGMAAMDAALNSSSVDEFMDQGNWGTVVGVVGAAGFGGFAGYQMYKAQHLDPNPSSKSVTSSPCDGTCFVAGTLIETENDSLPIEQITVGMMVYATNPETGETELKEVVNSFIRESSELVHITVNGEEITATPTHPFWVPQKGWTDAIDLRAGDKLQLLNGEYVIIEQVQHELLETPVTVYNFEVEGFHTYYVTESCILVHNANCGHTAPEGGGGVTDRIKVGNTNVEFSHGGRHLEGTGLNMNQVNQAIANDVVNRPPTNGVVGHGTVNVGGVDIYYNYFARSKDLINIGTYYRK